MRAPHQFPSGLSNFSVRNVTETNASIYIYGVVGDDWEGVSALPVVKEIRSLKGKTIDAYINSPGGSVFAGDAIYNALLEHKGRVNTHVDGNASSIASLIAIAGDTVSFAENATMMIHNPSAGVWGGSSDLRSAADVLDVLRETLVNAYANKTKKTPEEIRAAMDAETWFDAKQAKEWGLADEIKPGVRAVNLGVSDTVFEALNIKGRPPALPQLTEEERKSRKEITAKRLALFQL